MEREHPGVMHTPDAASHGERSTGEPPDARAASIRLDAPSKIEGRVRRDNCDHQ